MPLIFTEAIRRALRNVIKFGDTDIFPFPFERYTFDDAFDDCLEFLQERDKNFKDHLSNYPPLTIETLTQVGYTGFRRATQIEPFWNVYYLALVISIAEEIENHRILENKHTVYSYRYSWCENTHSLFGDSTWRDYRQRASELSKQFQYVVLSDIADFYPRINHHRLQNSLNRLDVGDTPSRIMELLKQFSKSRSYGLPVGGPASRILAELSLANVDKLLEQKRITYCRYADDYSIFCGSKAEAYEILVFLSEKLFHESLSLQKTKTQVLTSVEFADFNKYIDHALGDNSAATEEAKLLSVSIRFDPYSPTAEEDYTTLKEAVGNINILSILTKEVGKTTIDQTVTRQAINALRVLDVHLQEKALQVLLEPDNLLTLTPVFVNVMRAVRGIYDDLNESAKKRVDANLIDIFYNTKHLLKVELNLSYYIQALSRRQCTKKEQILVEIFDQTVSHLLKRQVIRVLSEWKCHHWISDRLQNFNTFTEWERRAFIIGSYCLGEEGRHWRRNSKQSFGPAEKLIKNWAKIRYQKTPSIPI